MCPTACLAGNGDIQLLNLLCENNKGVKGLFKKNIFFVVGLYPIELYVKYLTISGCKTYRSPCHRRLARKKNADPDLLAQIKRIKKKEATNKKKRDKWREYKNEVLVGGKTRRQIHAEWLRAHRKSWSWRIRNELDNMKIALGLQYIKPLIVATKVNID